MFFGNELGMCVRDCAWHDTSSDYTRRKWTIHEHDLSIQRDCSQRCGNSSCYARVAQEVFSPHHLASNTANMETVLLDHLSRATVAFSSVCLTCWTRSLLDDLRIRRMVPQSLWVSQIDCEIPHWQPFRRMILFNGLSIPPQKTIPGDRVESRTRLFTIWFGSVHALSSVGVILFL